MQSSVLVALPRICGRLAVDVKLEPLPRSFYEPSAADVAPRLLGHWLLRRTPAGLLGGPIVETEAYLEGDPACHAFRGETKRNRAMWGDPGRSYVYLIYGFHHCVNAVCRPKGCAEAVLIRAIEATIGIDAMSSHRPSAQPCGLTSGPGKLCAALAIDRALNGVDLCDPDSPLVIARNQEHESFLRDAGPVITTTRVGIVKAACQPLRHYLDNSPFVSKRVKERVSAMPLNRSNSL